MKKTLLLPFVLLVLILSCTRRPADLDAAIFLYDRNQLEEALPVLEDLAAQGTADARTLAYLAETYRRFGKNAMAVETARRALAVDPCNAFAQTVIADASDPLTGSWEGADADTTWYYLLRATECDPKDGNPWLSIWKESIRRREEDLTVRAAEKMMETGFFTKALLSYTEWVLVSLPRNAIVLTNGDMDTYPAVALQTVEELRPDVVVVNRGLLSQPWYARWLRDEKGVPLPFSDGELGRLTSGRTPDGAVTTPADKIIGGWIDMRKEGKMRNPVACAATVPSEYAAQFGEPVRYVGAYNLVMIGSGTGPGIDAMMKGLETFSPEDFFGPWVSDQDRSPVRRIGTKNIVRNVTFTALTIAEALLDSDDPSRADRWLGFAEALDNGSALGPVYTERIADLKGKREGG